MTPLPMTPLRWSFSFFAAWLLLPIAPALLIMLFGFVLPGTVPWSIVEASFPVASLVAFLVCALLLWRAPGPLALRLLATVAVAGLLGFVARIEVVMQAECGPPRGKFIDFQRQFQELNASGVYCG